MLLGNVRFPIHSVLYIIGHTYTGTGTGTEGVFLLYFHQVVTFMIQYGFWCIEDGIPEKLSLKMPRIVPNPRNIFLSDF
jgi:hypothetical protein